MADDAPEPQQPQVSTPYLVTHPDGSSGSYVLHTSRPPTIGEVADYATAQGQQFSGFPQGPKAPSPPPAEAPSPQLSTAPPPESPTLTRRVYDTLLPQRSLGSQGLSIGGAVTGGMYGAKLGAPLGPPGMIAGGLIGAGLGSGGGEAAQYGAEKAIGLEPAEPGTFAQRVLGATVRGTVAEAGTAPFRLVPLRAMAQAIPAAKAAEELGPILTRTAETAAPEGVGAAEQLSSTYALPRWWNDISQRPPAEIVKAWTAMTPEQQVALAGEHRDAMQTVVDTIGKGAEPWTGAFGRYGLASTPWAFLSGHPLAAVGSAMPAAWDVVDQVTPKALSYALRTPGAVPKLLALPRAAAVAGPIFGTGLRTTAQGGLAATGEFPPAKIFPGGG